MVDHGEETPLGQAPEGVLSPPWTWRLVGISIALLYIITPFRVGDFYPLARFAMFSQHTVSDRRLVVEVSGEQPRPVEAFLDYSCEPSPEHDACHDLASFSYNEKHDLAYVERHKSGDVEVALPPLRFTVLRQSISFATAYGDPQVEACPLLVCTGRRGADDER